MGTYLDAEVEMGGDLFGLGLQLEVSAALGGVVDLALDLDRGKPVIAFSLLKRL